MTPSSHICRVCGFDNKEPRWIYGDPEWIICSCCGSEAGYEDHSKESVTVAREKWVSSGYKWFQPNERPEKWDLDKQLNNIPAEWK